MSIDPKLERKHKLITQLVTGNNILDIGFVDYPNKFLINPIGVDVQDVSTLPSNYIRAYRVNLNTQKLPFKNEFFDTVILSDVIEHVENASFVLRECNRVLKKNGKLIVSIPNVNSIWSNVYNAFLIIPSQNKRRSQHINNWCRRDFIALLATNGFNTIRQYGLCLTIPIVKYQLYLKNFPFLCGGIIYDACKIERPDCTILTNKSGAVSNVDYVN